ncbi:helix-turn-helix domain-containing protein [Lactobacillus xujianguonis]|uniref:helix-turn-helix domain-containing protein n=1 Tax=Lactobacillus xujianguonis TaxID=2495899 RepID=UPI00143D2102|nr:helix-turn-helix domain-containing protein [Lactobacillus xujianguonis]
MKNISIQVLFSKELLHSYLDAFLILLSRNTSLHSSKILTQQVPELVLLMLKEISQHYASVSLQGLAKKTNYNRSYLGSLFKTTTGKSFSAALTEQRLLAAYDLLTSTSLPIAEIINQVGLSNKTFFYQHFKVKFHKLPNQIREL